MLLMGWQAGWLCLIRSVGDLWLEACRAAAIAAGAPRHRSSGTASHKHLLELLPAQGKPQLFVLTHPSVSPAAGPWALVLHCADVHLKTWDKEGYLQSIEQGGLPVANGRAAGPVHTSHAAQLPCHTVQQASAGTCIVRSLQVWP